MNIGRMSMSTSFAGYRSVVVESFIGFDKNSRHGPVHIRPVAEEGFPEGIWSCLAKVPFT